MVLKRGNRNFSSNPPSLYRAEVVAQLVEQALLTPEVCGSKPVIGKIYIVRSLSTVSKKPKIQKKRQGMAHFNISPHSHSLYLSLSTLFCGSCKIFAQKGRGGPLCKKRRCVITQRGAKRKVANVWNTRSIRSFSHIPYFLHKSLLFQVFYKKTGLPRPLFRLFSY